MTRTQLQQEIKDFISHVRANADLDKPLVFWVDLFCGAGGTSSGIHFADVPNMFVAACVNHDKNAILSHAANHPHTLHFTEDIRDFEVVEKLKILMDALREAFPNCIFNLWASLECTNFSKAKGGQARDGDSRTLAEHMFMYLDLYFDYFWVENVREFLSWGPLDDNGKPVSRTAGRDYVAWVDKVKTYGYKSDKKILNAADYGAYQSRQRLFIQFAKKGLPISWPEQTHSKDKVDSPLFPIKRWKAVREVLDLDDEGVSIFERKKPLSENTLKRIYAGLEKFVAKGEHTFTARYNGGKVNPEGKVNTIEKPMGTILTGGTHTLVKSVFIKKYFSGRPAGKVIGVDGPAGTVTCVDGQAIVQASHFIQQRQSGNEKHRVVDIEGPARTITTTGGNQEIVTASHLNTYYGNGGVHDIESPSPTLTTKDRIAKVDVNFIDQCNRNAYPMSTETVCNTLTTKDKFSIVKAEVVEGAFIMNQFSGGGQYTDIEKPCSAVTTVPKQNLVNAKGFILNPAWGGNNGDLESPCCTVVARQDKAPLYLLQAEFGLVSVFVYESDNETMIKIKTFMVEYGIIDIKMRMLNMPELKQIQGFPKDYTLVGTQTEQKKYIGNAVEVRQARALTLDNYQAIESHLKTAA